MVLTNNSAATQLRCGTPLLPILVAWFAAAAVQCQADAEANKPAPHVTPVDFFYAFSDWTECSKPCGGGMQARNVSCLSATDAVPASLDDCAAALGGLSLQATQEQSCNAWACPRDVLVGSPLSPCSALCGGGIATRATYCASTAGYLNDDSKCAGTYETLVPEPYSVCNPQDCVGPHYVFGPWGPCSAPCGGGVQTRSAACVLPNGKPAASGDACGEVEPAALERQCNTAPCEIAVWQAGPWGPCDAPCGGVQTRERDPVCVFNNGTPVPADRVDALCPAAARPRAQRACAPCLSCQVSDCSGHGRCGSAGDGTCICDAGWAGPTCGTEVPAGACASGVVDGNGACCESGLVNHDGACCADVAPLGLDRDGVCCAGAVIDACGVCGGSGTAVDALGHCCVAPGQVSGRGICCASGQIDDCGVCDGDASTCATTLGLDVLAASGVAAPQTTQAAFMKTFRVFLCATLDLGQVLCKLTTMKVEQTLDAAAFFQRRLLAQMVLQIKVEIPAISGDVLQAIVDAGGQAPTLTLGHLLGSIAAVRGEFIGDFEAQVVGDASASKGVVCGDGICGAGEQPVLHSTVARPLACAADCLPDFQCAAPGGLGVGDHMKECGGNGFCDAVNRECLCFPGYSGDACEFCDRSFVAFNGTCLRFDIVAPDFDGEDEDPQVQREGRPGPSSGGRSRDEVLAIVLGVLAGVIALPFLLYASFLLWRRWRRRKVLKAQRRSHARVSASDESGTIKTALCPSPFMRCMACGSGGARRGPASGARSDSELGDAVSAPSRSHRMTTDSLQGMTVDVESRSGLRFDGVEVQVRTSGPIKGGPGRGPPAEPRSVDALHKASSLPHALPALVGTGGAPRRASDRRISTAPHPAAGSRLLSALQYESKQPKGYFTAKYAARSREGGGDVPGRHPSSIDRWLERVQMSTSDPCGSSEESGSSQVLLGPGTPSLNAKRRGEGVVSHAGTALHRTLMDSMSTLEAHRHEGTPKADAESPRSYEGYESYDEASAVRANVTALLNTGTRLRPEPLESAFASLKALASLPYPSGSTDPPQPPRIEPRVAPGGGGLGVPRAAPSGPAARISGGITGRLEAADLPSAVHTDSAMQLPPPAQAPEAQVHFVAPRSEFAKGLLAWRRLRADGHLLTSTGTFGGAAPPVALGRGARRVGARSSEISRISGRVDSALRALRVSHSRSYVPPSEGAGTTSRLKSIRSEMTQQDSNTGLDSKKDPELQGGTPPDATQTLPGPHRTASPPHAVARVHMVARVPLAATAAAPLTTRAADDTTRTADTANPADSESSSPRSEASSPATVTLPPPSDWATLGQEQHVPIAASPAFRSVQRHRAASLTESPRIASPAPPEAPLTTANSDQPSQLLTGETVTLQPPQDWKALGRGARVPEALSPAVPRNAVEPAPFPVTPPPPALMQASATPAAALASSSPTSFRVRRSAGRTAAETLLAPYGARSIHSASCGTPSWLSPVGTPRRYALSPANTPRRFAVSPAVSPAASPTGWSGKRPRTDMAEQDAAYFLPRVPSSRSGYDRCETPRSESKRAAVVAPSAPPQRAPQAAAPAMSLGSERRHEAAPVAGNFSKPLHFEPSIMHLQSFPMRPTSPGPVRRQGGPAAPVSSPVQSATVRLDSLRGGASNVCGATGALPSRIPTSPPERASPPLFPLHPAYVPAHGGDADERGSDEDGHIPARSGYARAPLPWEHTATPPETPIRQTGYVHPVRGVTGAGVSDDDGASALLLLSEEASRGKASSGEYSSHLMG